MIADKEHSANHRKGTLEPEAEADLCCTEFCFGPDLGDADKSRKFATCFTNVRCSGDKTEETSCKKQRQGKSL